jgi:hypothetical protein
MLRRILTLPVLYALLVLVFAACAQPGTPVSPTEAPATEAPTDVPPTPEPTATTAPTVAPTATSSEPTATPDIATMFVQTSTVSSPDGAWVAQTLVAYPNEGSGDYFGGLTVTSADGAQTWEALAEWLPTGLGAPMPAVLQWSADGGALYFTHVVQPDGCGFYSHNGTDLFRLDLSTGEVTQLMPDSGIYLALSPDELQVAYLAYGDRGLVVRQLGTGAEQTYPLADLGGQAGYIVWAPDASAVALTIYSEDVACGDGTGATTTVIQVHLSDGARSVLLPPDNRLLTTNAWPDQNHVRLTGPDGPAYLLEVTTGELQPEG